MMPDEAAVNTNILSFCSDFSKSDSELSEMQPGSSGVLEDGWEKRGLAYLQGEASGQPLIFRKLLCNRPVVRKESAESRNRR